MQNADRSTIFKYVESHGECVSALPCGATCLAKSGGYFFHTLAKYQYIVSLVASWQGGV
jgi:GMP synthase-like glutamine amidotransferase